MKILVTGATGFVGRNLTPKLTEMGHEVIGTSSKDYNLIDYDTTLNMFEYYRPDTVIALAATCGGIGANMNSPGKFFYDNIMMGVNTIECARLVGVKKFVQLGTVCAYPANPPIPFKEESLFQGRSEPTNEPYSVAKLSLLMMLWAYRKQYKFNGIYLLPTNLYGKYDSFDDNKSHAIAAIIKKFHLAKKTNDSSITLFGDGTPTRDFLYVDDAVDGIIKAMESYNSEEPINLGSGDEISIYRLAREIRFLMDATKIVINYDASKPNGQMRRCLDITHARKELGWRPTTDLATGLEKTIEYFYRNVAE